MGVGGERGWNRRISKRTWFIMLVAGVDFPTFRQIGKRRPRLETQEHSWESSRYLLTRSDLRKTGLLLPILAYYDSVFAEAFLLNY